MNDQDKSKEELIVELLELRRVHNSLKASFEADLLETRQTQLALQVSEERYRNLLGNLDAGIVVHAPDTSILMNNPRASELLGLSNDQMRGKAAIDPAWKFINEDHTPLSIKGYPVNRILTGKLPIKNQILGIFHPGKNDFVWVTVNGFPVLSQTGDLIEIVISFIDITERKHSEFLLQKKTEEIVAQVEEYQQLNEELYQTNQELSEATEITERNESRLKMALKVSRSGAWDWDILKNTFYWSAEFLQLFGLPQNTIAGFEAWTRVLHPEDIEQASLNIQEAIENHTELLNDYRIVLPSKEIRWIRSTGHTAYVNNKPVRMLGLCMDITSQKTSELELYTAIKRAEESEMQALDILQTAIDGFWMVNSEGRLIDMNQVACKMLGYTREEMLTMKISDIDIVETSDQIQEHIHKVTATGSDWFETKHRCKDGSIIDVEVSSKLQPSKNSMLVFISDITERKQMVEELKYRENLLNRVFDLLPIGLWFADANGRLIRGNPAGVKIWGAQPTVSIEEYGVFRARHHPSGREIGPDDWALAHSIRNGVTIGDEQLEIDAFDGQKKIILNYTTPVLDDHGNIQGAIVVNQDITERIRADEALRDSEEKYRQLIENSHDIIYTLNTEGVFMFVSPAWTTLLGHPVSEVLGKPFQKLVHPDDVPACLLFLQHVITNEQRHEGIEYRAKHLNGKWHWHTTSAVPLRDRTGKVIGFEGTARDITSRIEAEEELMRAKEKAEENEEFFRKIFENSPLGKSITGLDGSLKTNRAFSSMLGYAFEEFQTKNFREITHPDDLQQTLDVVESLLNGTASVFQFEKRYLHKNGSVVYCEVVTTLQKNRYGKPLFFITSVNDITERKHLERIREIQLNIAKAVVTSDNIEQLLEFVRAQLNQLFDTTNFFGAIYNPKSDTLKKLHWVDEVDDFEEWDAGKSFSGYVVKTGKTLLLNKKEIEILAVEQGIPIIGTPAECCLGVPLLVDKNTIGVLVIQSYTDENAFDTSTAMLFEQVAYDISVFIEKTRIMQDLTVAKNHAEESDRLKSAFLANMSHEIRTPMNGILGFAELLKTPDLSGEQQNEYIKIIEKSGARMLNVINDIINISKIEAGLMQSYIKESNINEQIEYIYTFFKPEVEAKGLAFSFRCALPAKNAIIKTDQEKLYAILTNLVKNSIKYTIAGYIEFGYDLIEAKDCQYLRFFVKDSGIGIPLDQQAAIFKRFIQADITDKMAKQGAGLGLSITKAYIEMLKGEIWVESQVGKGSTFYFTLPYCLEWE